LDARQGGRLGAGGDDDVFAGQFHRFPVGLLHRHLFTFAQGAHTVKRLDLVLFHEKHQPVVVLLYDMSVAGHHLAEIDIYAVDMYALPGRFMPDDIVVLRTVEQRFGRDATHIGTSASQRRVLLDDGATAAQLRRADGGGIASRPGTDDDDVEI